MLASTLLLSILAAPMPGDVELKLFREAFERGEAQFQQGDFGAAIANFREAERLRTTPEVAFDLAKCFEKLGDEAFATLYFRQYLRRAPDASDTPEVAQKVGAVIAKLEASGLGYLELEVPRGTDIRVNGRLYPVSPVALFAAPGEYDVTAQFPAGPKRMSVQLRRGRTTTVAFEPLLPPLVTVEQALTPEMVMRGLDAPPTSGRSQLRVASYIVAGVGLAAAVVGMVLGASAKSDETASRNQSLRVSEATAVAQSSNGKAIGANLLFGVGGAAVAGAALMFTFSMPEPGMKQQVSP
jgi:hypothetical protein